MSTPFQNRIVGTIIVAAAVIIFLPNLLDGEKQSYQADFDAIPNAPQFTGKSTNKVFPQEQIKPQKMVTIVEEIAQDQQLFVAEGLSKNANDKLLTSSDNISVTPVIRSKAIVETTNKNRNTKNTEDATQASNKHQELPEKAIKQQAWVIHLGSFKHKKNVAELLTKLKKHGYTAYTKPIKTKQGNLTKVFIGPELIKSSLEKKLPNLKKLTHVQGKIARFYPTK